jgi:hypothetical protein
MKHTEKTLPKKQHDVNRTTSPSTSVIFMAAFLIKYLEDQLVAVIGEHCMHVRPWHRYYE